MDILCFGSADFAEPNWVNAQHLMWRLARRHRVLYVDSLGLRAPGANTRDLRKVLRRARALLHGITRPDATRELYVLSPLTFPLGSGRLGQSLGTRLLAVQLRAALRRLGFERPLTWVFLPSAAPVLDRLDIGPVIYHCVDAYAANPGVDRARVEHLERRVLAHATHVLATSAPLYRQLSAAHPRAHLMPNVADIAAYPPPAAPPSEPRDLARFPRPRIGYVGNLAAYKCDLGLLCTAAAARPDLSWIFVGAVGHGESQTPIRALTRLPNVHVLGERPRESLAAYIHHIDVGLIPFRMNETTRHSFPMKFFEYLACGKPVVTAALESLREHCQAPLVFTYDHERMFLPAIDRALAAGGTELAARRRALAEQHSWEHRMAEIEALLAEMAGASHQVPLEST